MKTIFLSHSSKDKEAVKRLATELIAKGYRIWLDEWKIEVGDSVIDKIQQGLQAADFIAVWLTRNAVASGWVSGEWQTRIIVEMQKKNSTVLPLLADDCEIPFFLSNRHYADFRESFENGLNQLIRTLRQKSNPPVLPIQKITSHSILRNVENFLGDLAESQIPFPTIGSLKLIPALKQLPRSGKLIRLESMVPAIPIRSIYDHILSVGHAADVLLDDLSPALNDSDLVELARVIAYHDLCESILGDLPQYTKLNASKRRRARVEAEVRLSQLPNGVPEKIANDFIGMFLQDSERLSLQAAQKIMNGTSEIQRYYYAMDKLDPIVATWRYIHILRNRPGFSIEEYLQRMRHFFENPNVAKAIERNINDRRLLQFVRQLQTPALARSYYNNPNLLHDHRFALPAETVQTLIEGRMILFTQAEKLSKLRNSDSKSSNQSPKKKNN